MNGFRDGPNGAGAGITDHPSADLELGVDIGHLDAAVLAGYPGSIASLLAAGRAGRRSGKSAAVFVASSALLDQFMATHPDYLFGTPLPQAPPPGGDAEGLRP